MTTNYKDRNFVAVIGDEVFSRSYALILCISIRSFKPCCYKGLDYGTIVGRCRPYKYTAKVKLLGCGCQ